MAEVAAAIGLGSHLRLSRGEDKSGLRRKSTVLSNAMEAVLGALFLDGGLEPVRAFARRWVMGEAAEQLAEQLRSGAALGNYKSALQEHLQATRAGAPVYRVKSESGPDHRKRFLVEVRLKARCGSQESNWRAARAAPRNTPSRMPRGARWSGLKAPGQKSRRPARPAPNKRRARSAMSTPDSARHASPLSQRFCAAAAPSAHSARGPGLAAQTVVVALFLLTFVLQPYLIPSESMERTLLVGDFLLVNKQVYAPAGSFTRWLLPYRDVARGDIVVFHHPQHPYLVKRVVGIPGDRLRIEDGRVTVNGVALDEPTRPLNPPPPIPSATIFPPGFIPIPRWIRPGGSRCRASPATANWWCPRASISCSATTAITARIPASGALCRGSRLWPGRWSSTSRLPGPPPPMSQMQAADDRLGHDRELSARLTGFARWKRIFHVVH